VNGDGSELAKSAAASGTGPRKPEILIGADVPGPWPARLDIARDAAIRAGYIHEAAPIVVEHTSVLRPPMHNELVALLLAAGARTRDYGAGAFALILHDGLCPWIRRAAACTCTVAGALVCAVPRLPIVGAA
jgi:hypothetical protein